VNDSIAQGGQPGQMPDNSPLDKLAESLFLAEAHRRPIKPLTLVRSDLTLADAYRIQQINVDRRLRAGESIIGHKIGLTAKAMQQKFGVNEPDFGHLLNTMLLDGTKPLDMSELIDPQIEVEPAFVLGADLSGPDVSIDDVLAATDYICVCFEVIDSRIVDWQIKLQDTVADNGSSSRLLLGSEHHSADAFALDDLETELYLDGEVVETGNTNAILGNPASGIVWLANVLSSYGSSLKAGDIVLPGTCTKSRRFAHCSEVSGRIEKLGEVRLNLTGKPTITSSAP
jgi:2-keto-4-pentenoate hydratase